MTAQQQRDNEFFGDFLAFRAKYPDVYVEVWAPPDFGLRWGSRASRKVVDILEDEFDAERGTNWPRVLAAVDQVKVKKGSQ